MNLEPGAIAVSQEIPQLDLQKCEENQEEIKIKVHCVDYSEFSNLK